VISAEANKSRLIVDESRKYDVPKIFYPAPGNLSEQSAAQPLALR
jgi:hypothetical protein